MKISYSKFDRSFSKLGQMPDERIPELAFIGRSNVGKSSLINFICNNKKLAQTSSKPGKTKLINRYLIENQFYLVDLPGYGYAKVSMRSRLKFDEMITEYLLDRKSLFLTFLLLDLSIDPQPIDFEFIRWCGENGIPFVIVFTKIDKVKSKDIEKKIADFELSLSQDNWDEIPEYLLSSSTSKEGKESFLAYLSEILSTYR
ncbi:MAG: putative GTP-binding protein EngB [Bacteroidetes bacterium MED-G17]|nr:MAG: putative GTP-binding protein EngB [Bacteroidetes bacterium MED-G17]